MPKFQKRDTQPHQDVNPAAMSAIRPGAPVVQIDPKQEQLLNQIAQTEGVDRTEAMRRIMDNLPPAKPPKPSISDQSLGKIQQARELGLTSEDQNDPLNQMMRYGFYKDMKKDIKKADETERLSIRDQIEYAILLRMLPAQSDGQATPQYLQIISEMKAENERSRQFYEQKLREQEEKFREVMLEKKMQDMDEKHTQSMAAISQQLIDMQKRLELYQNIPPNPTPEQKMDAISHLEELSGQIDRIKNVASKFGVVQAQTGVPGDSLFKNPDGSMNTAMWVVDRIGNTVQAGLEAWQKKVPDHRQVENTPMQENYQQQPQSQTQPHQQQYPQRQLTPDEYAAMLTQKQSLTQQDIDWINKYNEYKYQETLAQKQQQQQKEMQEMAIADAERRKRIAMERTVEQPTIEPIKKDNITNNETEPPSEQDNNETTENGDGKSMIQKLKEQEEAEIKRSQELGR